ncbi:MAG: alpha/beta hydrolase [Actinomycetota bacterium]
MEASAALRTTLPTALPTTEAPTAPPGRNRLAAEWTTALQPLRLLRQSGDLRRAPRGDGRLVVDIPGWLTGSESLVPLRWYLNSLGHRAEPWQLGRNGSDVEATVERFEPVLEQLVASGDGRPAFLVGWSLGGVIARETARNRPDLVDRLVTFGTPAQGGPSFTAGASRFGAEECARIAALQDEANRTDPLSLPTTAIYTKADGVVDWKACVDPWATNIRHVEVGSSHFGLGVDPDVWSIIARALAAE